MIVKFSRSHVISSSPNCLDMLSTQIIVHKGMKLIFLSHTQSCAARMRESTKVNFYHMCVRGDAWTCGIDFYFFLLFPHVQSKQDIILHASQIFARLTHLLTLTMPCPFLCPSHIAHHVPMHSQSLLIPGFTDWVQASTRFG